jgi:hypothetical protein
VAAVEAFIEQNSRDQTFMTREIPPLTGLNARLRSYFEDEVDYRRDAEQLLEQSWGVLHDAWATPACYRLGVGLHSLVWSSKL